MAGLAGQGPPGGGCAGPPRDGAAALRRSLRNSARDVAQCIGRDDAPRRLADLQDRTRVAEGRLAEIADALATAPEVTSEAVQAALAAFDRPWDAMPVADRCRLLSLLIERVTYDGQTIAIAFRQNGFTAAGHE